MDMSILETGHTISI